MTERTHTITRAEARILGPASMVARLKEHGFVFASEFCPIKLAGDGGMQANVDGSFTFRQTIEPSAQVIDLAEFRRRT